jgi:tricarballylate dehydrogenase
MAARDAHADVILLERAPRPFRGGNSRHTRNIRMLHATADGYVTGPYKFEEFAADLAGVTGSDVDNTLAEKTIRESETIGPWMLAHGARWQAPLKGTLGLARTNHFFLGGGKALMNAYYRTADASGVEVRYETCVIGIEVDGARCRGVWAEDAAGRTFVESDTVVVASGGFEANREWLAEYWGPAARNFVVRGTPYNDGRGLRLLLEAGASTRGDPQGAHAIAVDGRSPADDAGIVTRLDAIPIGIAVNCHGERFYDEGEDIWPKRYATWGRLIADQPDQKAFAIYDAKVAGETIPSLYPPVRAESIEELAETLGLDSGALVRTVAEFNAHCRPGHFDLSQRDGSRTEGLVPPKSHWARPLDTGPFFAYPMRPGITFTYMGVAVDKTARVLRPDGRFDNLFAAGEIMSGNFLTRGYLAGFGMTIGSVWGRIAGREAARA